MHKKCHKTFIFLIIISKSFHLGIFSIFDIFTLYIAHRKTFFQPAKENNTSKNKKSVDENFGINCRERSFATFMTLASRDNFFPDLSWHLILATFNFFFFVVKEKILSLIFSLKVLVSEYSKALTIYPCPLRIL